MKIYHNNRCGKSRQTLELLKSKGLAPEIIEYLKTPPTKKELEEILVKLKMKPEELVRKGESLYKEKFAGKTFSDEEWINILTENPILIERPIVVHKDKAVIGRPPESVLKIV